MLIHMAIIYYVFISVCQLLIIKIYGVKFENVTSKYEKAILLIESKTFAGKLIFYGYVSEVIVTISLALYLFLGT